MNCNEARCLFSLCIDCGLSFDEQGELDSHLRRCSTCSLELERVRRAVEMVRRLPEVQVAPLFVQDVLSAAREIAKAPRKDPRKTLWERLRAKVTLDWDPSPRLAFVGASLLILGIVVGVGGGLLVFGGRDAHSPALGETASVTSSAGTHAGVTASGSLEVTPVPVGPFDDLVQRMVHRPDMPSTTTVDTTGTPLLDWGSARLPGPIGQPVDAKSGSRVYIDF